jgi:hypothetical protein
MKIVALAGLVMLVMFSSGCVECECTCQCTDGATQHEETTIVPEEADCAGECDAYVADTCPNVTAQSFSVDCS